MSPDSGSLVLDPPTQGPAALEAPVQRRPAPRAGLFRRVLQDRAALVEEA